ncbi:gas vesicle protein GvpO [Alkalicoccus halolimnae]|uniref:Gas vesicle protein GvpO n=1 Tax=Alkalicoccus halolimnae TaxID=1667239 RepID=A0A5C7F6D5_9BACI|nr:gas vesicle protein GvpO [Alkalicoccus halolimnae]TXF85130.1 gas vesicle protein GvpR [Alkalicoccus halolimnae]
MKTEEIISTTKDYFREYLAPVHRITAITSRGKNWEVGVEVIEEKEYMKRYGRDQLIGTYLVRLDEDLEVTSFERTSLRKRTSTSIHGEEEAE